jgi:glycerol-3-phosphate acyltransferase PlsY
MIALFPIWTFLGALVVWVALFYGTGYVSVASIAAAISLPVTIGCWWLSVSSCAFLPPGGTNPTSNAFLREQRKNSRKSILHK